MLNVQTILCPIDFTPASDRALEVACRLSQRLGARLVIEHNLEAGPPGYLTVSWMWSEEHKAEREHRQKQAEKRLTRLLAELPSSLTREARLTRGPTAEALLFLARELPADLMVMGTHGASTAAHRSMTEEIVTTAPCPVLALMQGCSSTRLTGSPAGEERLVIVVPVDLSMESRAALAFAFELAEALPVRLVVVHVGAPGASDGVLRRRLSALVPAEHREHTDCRVLSGAGAAQLIALGHEVGADLVMMATPSRRWFARHGDLGVAFDLLHDPTCPIWFLPPGYHPRLREGEPGTAGAAPPLSQEA